MLMGAPVAWIERHRPPVMHERGLQLSQSTVGVANVILDVGVIRFPQRGERERRDSCMPLLGGQRLLPSGEIRVERRPVYIRGERSHGGADWPGFHAGKHFAGSVRRTEP